MIELSGNTQLLLGALGTALLHSLWQGLLIGLLFKVVLAFMAKASADLRYWTSVSALALLAVSVPATMLYLLAQSIPGTASAIAGTSPAADMAVPAHPGEAFTGASRLVDWTVWLWIAGVAVVSIRTLAAWRRVDSLRRAADMAGAESLLPLLERLRGLFGVGEPVVQRKTVTFDFDPGEGCRIPTGTRLPSC